MKGKKLFLMGVFGMFAMVALFAAPSQEYPNKPIDLVIASTAGSGGDVTTRLIAKYLGQELNVSINVINVGGGAGIPAVQQVLSAMPDGYTLMAEQGLSSSFQAALGTKTPYDMYKDRLYINKIASGPQVLCGRNDQGWKDIRDVAAQIKQNPSAEFIWAGIGASSAANFAVIQFMQAFNIDKSKTKEIRYGGGGEILTAIAGKHVMIGSCAASGVPSFVQDGKVQPLVVCGASRLSILPDIPSAKELGLDNLNADFWIGISGSAQLPENVVTTLDAATQRVIKNENFIKDLGAVGVVVNYTGPAGIVDFIKNEANVVSELVKQ
jgi:tripartite-type tricarboxylate transporter receptor subunit TctC